LVPNPQFGVPKLRANSAVDRRRPAPVFWLPSPNFCCPHPHWYLDVFHSSHHFLLISPTPSSLFTAVARSPSSPRVSSASPKAPPSPRVCRCRSFTCPCHRSLNPLGNKEHLPQSGGLSIFVDEYGCIG
jgi:hypothetical protein